MKGYYQKAPSVKKTFPHPEPTEQYEQPLGPPRPTATQRFESEHQFLSGAAQRVKGAAMSGAAWMQQRGQEINEESKIRRKPATAKPTRAQMDRMLLNETNFSDPFGMSRGGNPFGMGLMTGPFMDRDGPIRRDAPAPRRRRRKRRRDYDDDRRTPAFADPFHIPDSMRHMF